MINQSYNILHGGYHISNDIIDIQDGIFDTCSQNLMLFREIAVCPLWTTVWKISRTSQNISASECTLSQWQKNWNVSQFHDAHQTSLICHSHNNWDICWWKCFLIFCWWPVIMSSEVSILFFVNFRSYWDRYTKRMSMCLSGQDASFDESHDLPSS